MSIFDIQDALMFELPGGALRSGSLRDVQDVLIFELGIPLPTIISVTPSSGPTTGGTAVTIKGNLFVAGATVTFGGSPAWGVVVVDDTTITCVTPHHAAGSVAVTVATSNGSGTLQNGFTYIPDSPPPSDGHTPVMVFPSVDGYIYTIGNVGAVAAKDFSIIKWDMLVGTQSGFVGFPSVPGFAPSSAFDGNPQDCVLFDWLDASTAPQGTLRQLIAYTALYGGTIIVERSMMPGANSQSGAFVWNQSIVGFEQWSTGGVNSVSHICADSSGHVWICKQWSGQAPQLYMYDTPPPLYGVDGLQQNANAYQHFTGSAVYTPPLNATLMADMNAMAGAIGGVNQMLFSHATNEIVFIGDGGVGVYSIDSQIYAWAILSTGGTALGPVTSGGSVLLANGDILSVAAITPGSTAPADVPHNFNDWIAGCTTAGRSSWDPNTDSVWVIAGSQVYRLYLDRVAGNGVDVGEVIRWLCAQTDLLPWQYDVTQIMDHDFVHGVQFGQESVHDSIVKLMQVFQIDAAETNGCIIFTPRARAPYFVINEDDIGANDSVSKSEPRVQEVLTNETDIPERVSLVYFDTARNSQQALQYDKRIERPWASTRLQPVTNSRHEMTLTVPITSDATTMKRQAQKVLYEMWAARFQYQLKTSQRYLQLDAGDIGRVSYKGNMLEIVLTAIDRGAGLAIQFKATSHDSKGYDSLAVSQPGGSEPSVAQKA